MALLKPSWWYKPKHNQRERENTDCIMAKGWSTQLSTTPDKKKCGMSQRCWMMSFRYSPEFYNFFTEKAATPLPKALLNQ